MAFLIWSYARLPVLLTLVAGCPRSDDGRGDQAGSAPHAGQTVETATACSELPDAHVLKKLLKEAAQKGEAGGLNSGRFEWGAVVDRHGVLCAVAASSDDPAATWPGSQAIAKAKAFTANAFSTDTVPLSTARLYTLSQPGHSLWGIAAGNPLHPDCVGPPSASAGVGRVCGGSIAFGGGVPLYRGKVRVGGLGVSGDTACADHEIAKRVRDAASLNPAGGMVADDITYSVSDGPTVYTHPLCPNTWRNGIKVGDEAPAQGY